MLFYILIKVNKLTSNHHDCVDIIKTEVNPAGSPCHRARPGHARAPVGGSCPRNRASPGVRDAGHGTGTNVPDLEYWSFST